MNQIICKDILSSSRVSKFTQSNMLSVQQWCGVTVPVPHLTTFSYVVGCGLYLYTIKLLKGHCSLFSFLQNLVWSYSLKFSFDLGNSYLIGHWQQIHHHDNWANSIHCTVLMYEQTHLYRCWLTLRSASLWKDVFTAQSLLIFMVWCSHWFYHQ